MVLGEEEEEPEVSLPLERVGELWGCFLQQKAGEEEAGFLEHRKELGMWMEKENLERKEAGKMIASLL